MAKKKTFDAALENLDGFMTEGARAESRQNIPTGHFDLDFALHYAQLPSDVDLSTLKDYDPSFPLGLPCGRFVELYGEEGSGKSSLAYRTCGMAQKMGYKALWIDTEHSFEEKLAELNGCDVDKLLYSKASDASDPDKIFYAEDIMDKIVAACKNAEKYNLKVIVLDSIANLIPKDIGMQSANNDTMALLARILSKSLPKIAQHASIHNVLVIFINQIREKPGVMFGNPITTPGGRSLKFNASVRLCMTKRGSKDELIFVEEENAEGEINKIIVGRNSGMSIHKNRCAAPLLDSLGNNITIDLPVYYKPYFPEIEEIAFNIARQVKLVSVRVGVYTWKSSYPEVGDLKIEGKTNFINHILDNDLLYDFVTEIKKTAEENGVMLPPELVKVDMKSLKKKTKKTNKTSNKEAPKKKEDVLEDMFNDPDPDSEPEELVSTKGAKRGRKKKSS